MIHYRRVVAFGFLLLILLAASPQMSFADEQIFSIEETAQIDLGMEISCIAVDEKLNRIYVGSDNTVVVIDGESKQVLTTVQCYNGSYRVVSWIVVDSLNNEIWVNDGQRTYLIDGETYSIYDAPNFWSSGARTRFAVDPQRKCYYVVDLSETIGYGDEILVRNSANFIGIREIVIPGSSSQYVITKTLDIAIDIEWNRLYAYWDVKDKIFAFNVTNGTLINQWNSTNIIDEITQIHDNKIYTSSKIFDANTLDEISELPNGFESCFNHPDDSIAYGFQDTGLRGDYDSTLYSLQAIDALTNRAIASSHESFDSTYDWEMVTVNIQTGEIYLAEESGLIRVWTITASPSSPPQVPTDEEPTTDEQPTIPPEPNSNLESPVVTLVGCIIVVGFILAFLGGYLPGQNPKNKPRNSETRQKE